jgi:hypothetical protein
MEHGEKGDADFSLVLGATGFEGGVSGIFSEKREPFEPCTIPTISGIPRAAPLWCSTRTIRL